MLYAYVGLVTFIASAATETTANFTGSVFVGLLWPVMLPAALLARLLR